MLLASRFPRSEGGGLLDRQAQCHVPATRLDQQIAGTAQILNGAGGAEAVSSWARGDVGASCGAESKQRGIDLRRSVGHIEVETIEVVGACGWGDASSEAVGGVRC